MWDLKQDNDDQVIIACTSALKPLLTQQQELLRITFCLTIIDPETCEYDDCFQSVHVDDRWFFISKKELCLFSAPSEVMLMRRCQYRDHLLKVMFLAAVACPCFEAEGEYIFDGKIGMWPFVERVAAKRTKKNCKKGMIET